MISSGARFRMASGSRKRFRPEADSLA
jgi:hypothetical protein